MSLQPQTLPAIPEETARVARAAFSNGNLLIRMRDELGVFFADEDFASLYPRCGHAAEAPWRLALITIMQFVKNLSDRQAAEAVRARIDWKYALSLELVNAGFNHSVLSEFRDRLLAGGVEEQLLDLMLNRFQRQGLLKARGQQRSDSTHVLAVVREMTRVSCDNGVEFFRPFGDQAQKGGYYVDNVVLDTLCSSSNAYFLVLA